MSNTDTNAKSPTKQSTTITCDLYNPTTARRIIYDGVNVDGVQGQGNIQKSITVEAGETKRGVTLSRVIAEELRDRNRVKKDSDLVIKPQTTADDAKEPAAT